MFSSPFCCLVSLERSASTAVGLAICRRLPNSRIPSVATLPKSSALTDASWAPGHATKTASLSIMTAFPLISSTHSLPRKTFASMSIPALTCEPWDAPLSNEEFWDTKKPAAVAPSHSSWQSSSTPKEQNLPCNACYKSPSNGSLPSNLKKTTRKTKSSLSI